MPEYKKIGWESYEIIEYSRPYYSYPYDYFYRPIDYMALPRKTLILDDQKDDEIWIISKGK